MIGLLKSVLSALVLLIALAPSSTTAQNVLIGYEVRQYLGLTKPERTWVIGPPETWPEAIWREAQFTRLASIACTEATYALLMREQIIGIGKEDASSATVNDADIPPKPVVLRNYVETCLTPIDTISDPEGSYAGTTPENSNFLSNLVGEQQLRRLMASIVMIPGAVGKPCSGMLINLGDNSDGIGFLTAAHCLGSLDTTNTENPDIKRLNISRIVIFDDLNGQRYEVVVDRNDRNVEYNSLTDDIALIILNRDELPADAGLPISSASFEVFEHLYLVGQNELLREHRDYLAGNKLIALGLPQHSTVVTFGPLCRAHGQIEALLLHNCQTRWGTSGATMISIVNREVVIVGVHTGNRNQFELLRDRLSVDEANFLATSLARNYGILLGEEP